MLGADGFLNGKWRTGARRRQVRTIRPHRDGSEHAGQKMASPGWPPISARDPSTKPHPCHHFDVGNQSHTNAKSAVSIGLADFLRKATRSHPAQNAVTRNWHPDERRHPDHKLCSGAARCPSNIVEVSRMVAPCARLLRVPSLSFSIVDFHGQLCAGTDLPARRVCVQRGACWIWRLGTLFLSSCLAESGVWPSAMFRI